MTQPPHATSEVLLSTLHCHGQLSYRYDVFSEPSTAHESKSCEEPKSSHNPQNLSPDVTHVSVFGICASQLRTKMEMVSFQVVCQVLGLACYLQLPSMAPLSQSTERTTLQACANGIYW